MLTSTKGWLVMRGHDVLIGAVVAVVLMLHAAPASPQGTERGETCVTCGVFRWRAVQPFWWGSYELRCSTYVGQNNCNTCPFVVSDDAIDAVTIANVVLRSRSATELRAALEVYGKRLLIDPHRRLLVVRGYRCNPDAVEVMVYTSAEQAEALESLGVSLLSDFLSSVPASVGESQIY